MSWNDRRLAPNGTYFSSGTARAVRLKREQTRQNRAACAPLRYSIGSKVSAIGLTPPGSPLLSETSTLGYPKAALFTFCVALLLENTLSMLRGSLRAAHGDAAVEKLSGDSLAYELRNTYEGLMVAIAPAQWTVFSKMSLTQFAKTLLNLAKSLDLSRQRRRGPKKPATPRTKYHNGGHASTAKILALRKPK